METPVTCINVILDNILSNFNVIELSKLRAVSTTWKDAVDRRMRKNCNSHWLHFHENQTEDSSDSHIYDRIEKSYKTRQMRCMQLMSDFLKWRTCWKRTPKLLIVIYKIKHIYNCEINTLLKEYMVKVGKSLPSSCTVIFLPSLADSATDKDSISLQSILLNPSSVFSDMFLWPRVKQSVDFNLLQGSLDSYLNEQIEETNGSNLVLLAFYSDDISSMYANAIKEKLSRFVCGLTKSKLLWCQTRESMREYMSQPGNSIARRSSFSVPLKNQGLFITSFSGPLTSSASLRLSNDRLLTPPHLIQKFKCLSQQLESTQFYSKCPPKNAIAIVARQHNDNISQGINDNLEEWAFREVFPDIPLVSILSNRVPYYLESLSCNNETESFETDSDDQAPSSLFLIIENQTFHL